MYARGLAMLALLVACGAPRAPRAAASCPEAQGLLDESAAARAGGYVLRALARAEAADRACASETTRRAVTRLRAELAGAPGAPGDAADVRDATLLRLAGAPGRALARLRPIAARLDPAGLVELARLEAASQHAAEARAALELAAARAEQRHGGPGRWRWQPVRPEQLAALAFTPDGTKLVAADGKGRIGVWDLAGGYELWSMQSRGWPTSLDLSPDGARVAVATAGGPVEVWELATEQRLVEIPEVGPAAFTPDGHLVVTARAHDGLLVVELPSGKPIAKLGLGRLRGLAVARDRIYTGHDDRTRPPFVVVWERGGTHRKLEERPMPGSIQQLAATPRGELVVHLSDRIVIQDAAGKLRHAIDGKHLSIAVTPDGKQLVASDPGRGVKLFDLDTGRLIRRVEAEAERGVFAVHPRAPLLAAGGADGLSIWDLANATQATRFAQPAAALTVAFDADGRRLAVGSASGTATIWDLAGGRVTAVTPRASAPVTGVAFGPGGVLATATTATGSPTGRRGGRSSLDSLVAVWDTSGARRWSQELEQLRWIGFRPGTDTLATASVIPAPNGARMGLTLWDGKGARLPALGFHGDGAFAWSPDGTRIAYFDGSKIALEPIDGSRGAAIAPAAKLANKLAAFQPGGDLLAIAGPGGQHSLWDPATLEPERVIFDEGGTSAALAWSLGGDVLAAAAGVAVRLWDPRTGARLATLAAHAAVASIAFRPDGRLLALACQDGVVELWSVADGKLVASLAMPGEARGLVLAPDGAVDGALADGDPLWWVVGDTALPGLAVWDRQTAPGLLAARLAGVPAGTSPRAGLAGAAPPPAPPACVAALGDDGSLDLVSARASDDRSLSLCYGASAYDDAPVGPPACFVLELASGAFRPRPPTAPEVLRRPEPGAAVATLDGARVTVCHARACRDVPIPELAAARPTPASATVSDDGRLVAVIIDRGDQGATAPYALVHDVATGRRIRRLAVGVEASIAFLGDVLLVTNTPCAGPCASSWLTDPRTGRRLGTIGGATPIETTATSPARVTGDVWAFNDSITPEVVYQDVRTGRVVRRFHRSGNCSIPQIDDCDVRLVHAGGGIAILGEGRRLGDVTLLDARGAVVGQHRAPTCKP